MSVLPDLIEPGLTTLFCGSAASSVSARVGAYYAGPGNRFWPILHESGLTPHLFAPAEFRKLLSLGIGLTDLAKHEAGMDVTLSSAAYDADALHAKVEAAAPAILAFTGKRPAGLFLLKILGMSIPDYGEQPVRLGGTRIFVLPSPSGAAQRWWSAEPWHTVAARHRELRAVT